MQTEALITEEREREQDREKEESSLLGTADNVSKHLSQPVSGYTEPTNLL